MQLQLPCLQLQHHGHQIFLSSMSVGALMRLDREDLLHIANDPTQPDVAQRKPKPAKVKAIAVYVLNRFRTGHIYFAPLLLNILPAPTLQSLGTGIGVLNIPYTIDSQTRLIDGQHRLLGIRQAVEWLKGGNWAYLMSAGVEPEVAAWLEAEGESAIEQLIRLEIGVQVYGGLTVEQERQAFHDTNRLLDKPDATLCNAFDSSQPISAVARAVADKCSWFRGQVSFFSNSFADHPEHLLTFSTLVQATKQMFPVAPVTNDPETVSAYADWAIAFWDAVGCHLPEVPWNERSAAERKRQRSESLAVQAITFLALGRLANGLRLQQVSAENLYECLMPLATMDWNREHPIWLEQGILSRNPKTGRTTVSNTRAFVERLHGYLKSRVVV